MRTRSARGNRTCGTEGKAMGGLLLLIVAVLAFSFGVVLAINSWYDYSVYRTRPPQEIHLQVNEARELSQDNHWPTMVLEGLKMIEEARASARRRIIIFAAASLGMMALAIWMGFAGFKLRRR